MKQRYNRGAGKAGGPPQRAARHRCRYLRAAAAAASGWRPPIPTFVHVLLHCPRRRACPRGPTCSSASLRASGLTPSSRSREQGSRLPVNVPLPLASASCPCCLLPCPPAVLPGA